MVAMVIWTLRVFLPILLFILYYRVSLPAGTRIWPFAGKHRRSRQDLLLYRAATLEGCERPDCLSNFTLVDSKQAPHLFVKKTRVDSRARAAAPGAAAKVAGSAGPADGKKPDGGAAGPFPEEMLHLESLMNYMAFNRKQHRIFHPTEIPPPPSSPHPPTSGEPPSADFQSKANLDAQMVLKGAIHFKKYEVVHDVFESLTCARVKPAEKTFALMVDSMISAGDLPKASEFLMKMEQGGFAPDAALLDKVMELYARHKLQTDLGAKLSPEADEAEKIGLSAEAAEFIPEFTPGGGFEPVEVAEAAAPWLAGWGEGAGDWAEPGAWTAWTGAEGEQGSGEWDTMEWAGEEWQESWNAPGAWQGKEWKEWPKWDKSGEANGDASKDGKWDPKWKEWSSKDGAAWKTGKGGWSGKGAWNGKGSKKWQNGDSKTSSGDKEGGKKQAEGDKKAWKQKKAEADA